MPLTTNIPLDLLLPPKSPKSSMQRTRFIVHVGTPYTGRDAGYTRTVGHRGVDSLVVKQGIARLWHAREEAHVGVEAAVEEKRRGGAEGLREVGFERRVGVVVYDDAGAA
jgi:hypothetical protein